MYYSQTFHFSDTQSVISPHPVGRLGTRLAGRSTRLKASNWHRASSSPSTTSDPHTSTRAMASCGHRSTTTSTIRPSHMSSSRTRSWCPSSTRRTFAKWTSEWANGGVSEQWPPTTTGMPTPPLVMIIVATANACPLFECDHCWWW